MSETVWNNKTNRGRVVYNRKPHMWTETDVQRIVKAIAADNDSNVPLMSDIADRVIWELARFLNLDQVSELGVGIIVRLGLILRGIKVPEPGGHTERSWQKFLEAGTPAEDVSRETSLRQIRETLLSILEYINVEIGPGGPP